MNGGMLLSLSRGTSVATKANPPRDQSQFDPKTLLSVVGDRGIVREYRKKETVFTQGALADAIFYIQQGKVKLSVVSQKGKEAVVAILGAGDFIGEGCLAGQPLRIATATAATDGAILRLDKAATIRALHDNPGFAAMFIAHLLARNIRIEEDLIDQFFNSSEKRLARLLLLLANFGKEGQQQLVIPKMSQATLAEMIGTTRSRVSFFMNKFCKLGFIEYNGKLEIRNSLLNVVLYDKPELRKK